MRYVLALLLLSACGGLPEVSEPEAPSLAPAERPQTGLVVGELRQEIVARAGSREVAQGVWDVDWKCPHGEVITATIPLWQMPEFGAHGVLTFRSATKDGEPVAHWENLNLEPIGLD